MFNAVKYLLWDVDGTLYKSNPDLFSEIRKEIYTRISKELAVPIDEAKKSFLEWHDILGGATATVTKLGLDRNLVLEAVDAVDKTRYIKQDERLKHMLEVSLCKYKHLIVTNTSRQGTLRTLDALGLRPESFQALITADDVNQSKPNPEPFIKALSVTGAPAEAHLSVGDRETVDIEPAKRLGMRTVLVWGESKLADCSVQTVYEITRLLHCC